MWDDNLNTVNESNPFYGMRIVFDASLNDQEEDQYAFWRSLTGEQRLTLATRLTEELYRGNIFPGDDKRIHFDIEKVNRISKDSVK